MASEAHLRLAFSTERSVEDELARETASDSVTVAVSYLVMLVYIALALGTLPAGKWLFLLSVLRHSWYSPVCEVALSLCCPFRCPAGAAGVPLQMQHIHAPHTQ